MKALVFDVFGTCVDWRSGVARDAERTEWLSRCRGYQIDGHDHTNVFGPQQDAEERLREGYQRARDTFAARRRRFGY